MGMPRRKITPYELFLQKKKKKQSVSRPFLNMGNDLEAHLEAEWDVGSETRARVASRLEDSTTEHQDLALALALSLSMVESNENVPTDFKHEDDDDDAWDLISSFGSVVSMDEDDNDDKTEAVAASVAAFPLSYRDVLLTQDCEFDQTILESLPVTSPKTPNEHAKDISSHYGCRNDEDDISDSFYLMEGSKELARLHPSPIKKGAKSHSGHSGKCRGAKCWCRRNTASKYRPFRYTFRPGKNGSL